MTDNEISIQPISRANPADDNNWILSFMFLSWFRSAIMQNTNYEMEVSEEQIEEVILALAKHGYVCLISWEESNEKKKIDEERTGEES